MKYMQQALSLARLAQGSTSPNPAVGAVLVNAGKMVGQGYTQPPGGKHAEVMAIEQAGAAAEGSTLYVTLEPCCHYGRTPPCTQAIIHAGVEKVSVSVLDPNPLVGGQGVKELQAAGLKVRVGEEAAAATELNESFFTYITQHRPFVTVKYAMSLDGKIATRSGDSRWISSEESRSFAHHLRYINDAVMVGVNTVIADDPQLTSRCSGGRGGTLKKSPLRIVVDGLGRMPLDARLLKEQGQTLVATGRQPDAGELGRFAVLNAELAVFPCTDGGLDLESLLIELGRRQVTSVLVEGGGTLIGGFFDKGLVDKVVVFIAPLIIGGEGKSGVAGMGVENLVDAYRLERVHVSPSGPDTVVTGYVAR